MQLHASAVAVCGKGCLILGQPGSGKSTVALEMIALGAVLVADDRVNLALVGSKVEMSAPDTIAGLIEARGCGLIRMRHTKSELVLIADLEAASQERLPKLQTRDLLGCACPVIFGKERVGLASILVAALKSGGFLDPDTLMRS
jgi:HPr kinase/phosphorylase